MIEARTEEYRAAAAQLLGADRKIVLGMRRELRAIGKPVGTAIAEAIGGAMPARGGLSALVSKAKISLLVDLRRGVRISLNTPGMKTGQFEAGTIRHPTYGHKPWKSQQVPGGKGAAELERHADDLRARIIRVVEGTVS